MERLISCQYCNNIHDRNFDCGMRPSRRRFTNEKDKFRSCKKWKKKREQIRRRDLQLCQVCIRNLYNTVQQYNYTNLSVHHAESLERAWNKRLDDDNLLTVCDYHHELAEKGEIPLSEIMEIITEQNSKSIPPA